VPKPALRQSSFAAITGPPSAPMAPVHDRMPTILSSAAGCVPIGEEGRVRRRASGFAEVYGRADTCLPCRHPGRQRARQMTPGCRAARAPPGVPIPDGGGLSRVPPFTWSSLLARQSPTRSPAIGEFISRGLLAQLLKLVSDELQSKLSRRRSNFARFWREATRDASQRGFHHYLLIRVEEEGGGRGGGHFANR
jgi:hypothetical protein